MQINEPHLDEAAKLFTSTGRHIKYYSITLLLNTLKPTNSKKLRRVLAKLFGNGIPPAVQNVCVTRSSLSLSHPS
jgi:hypothetical protein